MRLAGGNSKCGDEHTSISLIFHPILYVALRTNNSAISCCVAMDDPPRQDRNHLAYIIAILIPIMSTSAGIWLAYSSTLATVEVAHACYNRNCTDFGWIELFMTPMNLWKCCNFCVQGVRIICALAKEWIMTAW